MSQNQGNLVITAVNAALKRDTEFFGKMDPYVKFQIGSQVLKTKEAKDMGKAPKWNQQLNARIQGEQIITFDIFDKDIGKDEYIAQGSYPLGKLFQYPGQTVQENVKLQYKGKDAGTINLNFQYFPDQQQQQFQQQGFNQFNQPQQQHGGFNQPQQQYYNQPPQQHGFNQPHQQQGFNQPQQQHGFNQPQQQQGFNNPMGGFNQPQQQQFQQQQGFNQPGQYPNFNGPQQQQGGFNQPQQYQGFNQPQQQGGFNQPQQGMYQGKYPMVHFNPSCGKCHGTGQNKKKNNGKPCGQCYQDAGYCKKCCGSMWDIKKNKRCEKCQNGRATSKDKKGKKDKDKKKK
ncbi:C2 domain [Pseudocohnilembus persalinus]|uniref:C2 domain n=1 Tax=Pseudocohnilembus persalinus TaxID=266149 RepID=A0A0V0QGE0_PSEPJ|nr:C2 domain [Pseudocohnilembus persalinus]|eukprot:KRX01184.1 C2 domain [Pseudocohnilembus persalinus]